MKISENSVVSIDYILKGDDGTVIDTSEGREPLSFIYGIGAIIPGLEKELDGNHPLAGMNLHFNVDVKDVREATKEELEHGHVH